jgi:hypothetical protein
VLIVDMIQFTEAAGPTFSAKAWVADKEIYNKVLTNMYWSVPLADLGHEGWELVGTSSENALMRSRVVGWEHNETSRPVRMNFFFKRRSALGI